MSIQKYIFFKEIRLFEINITIMNICIRQEHSEYTSVTYLRDYGRQIVY